MKKALLTLLVTALLSIPAIGLPDLLVSVNEFTGSTDAERYIGLYQDGLFVEGFHAPHTQIYNSLHAVRDLLQTPNGTTWVFNGTFTPTLWEITASGDHTLWTIPGWSLVNQTMRGGIAHSGNYLFLTDNNTASESEDNLIIRVDTTDMSYERFTLDPSGFEDPFDLAVLDGRLYTLGEYGGVWIHDVATMALVSSFDLPSTGEYFGITVDEDTNIYTTGYDFSSGSQRKIKKFASSGVLMDELVVTMPGNLGDIDVNLETGEIAVGTSNTGAVLLTTTSLDSYSSFQAAESLFGGGTFVAFPVVPEPSTSILLLAALGLVAGRRR